MKIEHWKKIKEYSIDEEIKDLKPGDLFLFGEKMANQKYTKEPGEEVTVYKIISIDKKENSICYIPVTERLEK